MTLNSLSNPVQYSSLGHPPPRKKLRITPSTDYTEFDFTAPTILGKLLPIPCAPADETKESIAKLLAPYKQLMKTGHLAPRNVHHPRIFVAKHRDSHQRSSTNTNTRTQPVEDMRISDITPGTASSKWSATPSSEASSSSNYINVYDVPDSCWNLVFHFCTTQEIIFNIGATNKFFQCIAVEAPTWIHRRVVLPASVYNPQIPKLIEDTLESMFLNWTSLKQLDLMLDPDTRSHRVTRIWRLLCTPRPKIQTLRIGNCISLPGGESTAVTEKAFSFLKLIQDIETLDFSFNMNRVSYNALVDFFAAQSGHVYTPPLKIQKHVLSRYVINHITNLNSNSNTNSNTNRTINHNHNHNANHSRNIRNHNNNDNGNGGIMPETNEQRAMNLSNLMLESNNHRNNDNMVAIVDRRGGSSFLNLADDGMEVDSKDNAYGDYNENDDRGYRESTIPISDVDPADLVDDRNHLEEEHKSYTSPCSGEFFSASFAMEAVGRRYINNTNTNGNYNGNRNRNQIEDIIPMTPPIKNKPRHFSVEHVPGKCLSAHSPSSISLDSPICTPSSSRNRKRTRPMTSRMSKSEMDDDEDSNHNTNDRKRSDDIGSDDDNEDTETLRPAKRRRIGNHCSISTPFHATSSSPSLELSHKQRNGGNGNLNRHSRSEHVIKGNDNINGTILCPLEGPREMTTATVKTECTDTVPVDDDDDDDDINAYSNKSNSNNNTVYAVSSWAENRLSKTRRSHTFPMQFKRTRKRRTEGRHRPRRLSFPSDDHHDDDHDQKIKDDGNRGSGEGLLCPQCGSNLNPVNPHCIYSVLRNKLRHSCSWCKDWKRGRDPEGGQSRRRKRTWRRRKNSDRHYQPFRSESALYGRHRAQSPIPSIDPHRDPSPQPPPRPPVVVPTKFRNNLSPTPSLITSPFSGKNRSFELNPDSNGQRTASVMSEIDPSLLSTLRDLSNDELELNFNLNEITLNGNGPQNAFQGMTVNDVASLFHGAEHYDLYRAQMESELMCIDRKRSSMRELGRESKLRRIYFREFCLKSFPDAAYHYLNAQIIESLSISTGDIASLVAFIEKCGPYPAIKKIEIDGVSPFRWRCAPLLSALLKCVHLCSIQLPSIVDAVDIIAFDAFLNAALNLSEIGIVSGDRQLFKPIHDVISKHGFRMDINPNGLRFIFARRKNKAKWRRIYREQKELKRCNAKSNGSSVSKSS